MTSTVALPVDSGIAMARSQRAAEGAVVKALSVRAGSSSPRHAMETARRRHHDASDSEDFDDVSQESLLEPFTGRIQPGREPSSPRGEG